jgi:hypothetical protein
MKNKSLEGRVAVALLVKLVIAVGVMWSLVTNRNVDGETGSKKRE